MGFNANAIKVARRGRIHVAPFGTTLPDDVGQTLDPAFVNVGYTGDDPVTFNPGRTLDPRRSWQSSAPVMLIPGDEDATVSGQLLEWKTDTIIAAFGGGSITETDNGVKYTPPGSDIYEMSVVVSWRTLKHRVNCRAVVERCFATESPQIALSRRELSPLPFTFGSLSVLEDDDLEDTDDDAPSWYFLSDSALWVPTGDDES